MADGYLYALDKQGRKLADSAILSAGKDTTMPFRVSGRVSMSRRHAYISAPEGINLAMPYGALRRKIKVQTIEKADQQILPIPNLNTQQNHN